MIKNKKHEALYNELMPLIKAVPAKDLLHFVQDIMYQAERMGSSTFMDENRKVTSYHPALPTEKLGKVFNVARNDLPAFFLSGAPADVEELLQTERRETLLKTMIELGLERRIRMLVQSERTNAPDYAI